MKIVSIAMRMLLIICGAIFMAPVLAYSQSGCCQIGTNCIDVASKKDCDDLGGTFYPGATCRHYFLGNFCSKMDSKGNWVRVANASGPRYNTEFSQGCFGRQYLAYNYPIVAANPAAPQVAEMDSLGAVDRSLSTMRVINPTLIAAVMQAFRNNGWAGLSDTIVMWAFGSQGNMGSFPDTFCYSTDTYFGATANGGIPPAAKGTFVVASWYSGDTMQIPSSFDFVAQAIIPTGGGGGVQMPLFGCIGIIILVALLIVLTLIIIRKRASISL